MTNPDAWGHFDLPAGATTVREVVAHLAAGDEPPEAVKAKDMLLACYPSDREPAAYSQEEIDRLADYLKRRYMVVVVDLANHMPSVGDPAGEAVAYWLEHADVLVLPSTSAKKSFNGVLDYLELSKQGVHLPPVVVPYIPSRERQVRQHQHTQTLLRAIEEEGARVVLIPNESKVDLADFDSIPIIQVTPALREAYWQLTEAVVRAPKETP